MLLCLKSRDKGLLRSNFSSALLDFLAGTDFITNFKIKKTQSFKMKKLDSFKFQTVKYQT